MSELAVSVRLTPDDVHAIAVALADELERRQAVAQNGCSASFPALLSLSEAAAELAERMPARSASQWLRWLYEAAPRGRVPGARKVASRWFLPANIVDMIGDDR